MKEFILRAKFTETDPNFEGFPEHIPTPIIDDPKVYENKGKVIPADVQLFFSAQLNGRTFRIEHLLGSSAYKGNLRYTAIDNETEELLASLSQSTQNQYKENIWIFRKYV